MFDGFKTPSDAGVPEVMIVLPYRFWGTTKVAFVPECPDWEASIHVGGKGHVFEYQGYWEGGVFHKRST